MLYNDINLEQEVYREDVLEMARWLSDEEVLKYLNEKDSIASSLSSLAQTTNAPVMTHYFNSNGYFYMIEHKKKSIGYLKIIPKGKNAEMVIAIGDKEKWGRGIGTLAIKRGLNEAFLNYRVEEVIAKINKENHRSERVFKKAGFTEEKELKRETQYSLTFNNYMNQYRG
ncbi:GNAT family N-acetyltransferase [Clostridium paraputrificum]|uniref:GNAT family N-acetyltransferase n=1 Tax=Clostridium TaxID=1485 RepID=UPI003D344532